MTGHRAAIAARESGVSVTIAYRARGASPYVIGFNPTSPIRDSNAHWKHHLWC
jgi:hypothetical protein